MGPQETPRSTLTKESAPAGGISPGTTVLAVRRELAPCSAGSQCTSSATRSLTWAALVSATTSSLSQKKANVGKFGQYWQCECDKGYSGNGIQCMDSNGTLSALPGQQVEVTLTMTAGLYDEAPVESEFNHGAAMESLLSEMESAGGSCSGDDCEASYEVTEV